MNRLMKELFVQHTPQANPDVMNGLAVRYMRDCEWYIDTVFRSAAKGFPPGLEYMGYTRCTPAEEFNEITRLKNNKKTYDLAHSDIYLVKYHFRFNGEDLPPRFIYLPYVSDGGVIRLSGSYFHISPVLSDKVISPGINSVFVRLLRDKVNFERCYHSLNVDGERETVQIVWSPIYRRSPEIKKIPATTKANTSIVHYLLAKYGFSQMFQKFAGFVPVVGTDDITEDKYPKEHWVICKSDFQMKPKTFVGDFYEQSRIRVAVPRQHWNPFVMSLVAGFYYVVDHFPNHVHAEFVDKESNWMILLGHIIFSGVFSYGKLHADIQEHFNSLDEYVDDLVIMKLHEIGYDVKDFYELMGVILQHFNSWVITAGETSTTLYGKTLEVLYYALFDITSDIFLTNFRLNKQAAKKALTSKEVIETMNKRLRQRAVFGLTRGNIAVSSVSYSGDNKYPKITAVVAQQQSISGASRGHRTRTVVDVSKRINTSMVEAGSLLFLSKSNPTPAVRVNMYIDIDLKTGTIRPKKKFEELRMKTDKLLKGILV